MILISIIIRIACRGLRFEFDYGRTSLIVKGRDFDGEDRHCLGAFQRAPLPLRHPDCGHSRGRRARYQHLLLQTRSVEWLGIGLSLHRGVSLDHDVLVLHKDVLHRSRSAAALLGTPILLGILPRRGGRA